MLLFVTMLACGTGAGPVVGSPGAVADVVDPRPCDPALSTNTGVSVPAGVVVVDRFDGQRRVEHLVVPMDDVVGLEHHRSAQPCSAIYLRLADGRRLLFDDARVDLGSRTLRLAEIVGVDADAVSEVGSF